MKISLAFIAALLLSVTPSFSEPSQQEILNLTNRVILRTNEGDINALNDLTTLPTKYAVAALLSIFKNNYNIADATAQNKAIGVKCAQVIATTPGGEKYVKYLLEDASENKPRSIHFQQISAIKCMLILNNKMSVRVLCSSLYDSEIGGRAAHALAMMKLPDAPYATTLDSPISKSDGIAKWRVWWDAHKDTYADKEAAP